MSRLFSNSWQAYDAFDGHGFDREKAGVALSGLLQEANLGHAWLILHGDTAVGYMVLCFGHSLEWLGRDAFVDEFYLREEYQARLGTQDNRICRKRGEANRDSRATSGGCASKCGSACGLSKIGIRRA
jgi:hypothetical protein